MKWFTILVLALTTACNQVPVADRVLEQHQTPKEESTESDIQSIGRMESIGAALGCVFAPQSCQKSK